MFMAQLLLRARGLVDRAPGLLVREITDPTLAFSVITQAACSARCYSTFRQESPNSVPMRLDAQLKAKITEQMLHGTCIWVVLGNGSIKVRCVVREQARKGLPSIALSAPGCGHPQPTFATECE
jgi:hypothetical protein